jgi:hypothetical protein
MNIVHIRRITAQNSPLQIVSSCSAVGGGKSHEAGLHSPGGNVAGFGESKSRTNIVDNCRSSRMPKRVSRAPAVAFNTSPSKGRPWPSLPLPLGDTTFLAFYQPRQLRGRLICAGGFSAKNGVYVYLGYTGWEQVRWRQIIFCRRLHSRRMMCILIRSWVRSAL